MSFQVRNYQPFLSRTQTFPRNSLSLLRKYSTDSDDNNSKQYDLAVIGAGPVGVQAAMVAASQPFNKKVCLIDAPRASGMLMNEATGEDLSLGGPTGLFSKALRDTSKRMKVSTLRGMGLRDDSVWNEIINACVDLAFFNAEDAKRSLLFAGVDLLEGFASFSDDPGAGTQSLHIVTKKENSDDSSSTVVHAKKILIATGSSPFRPENIPFDGKRVFDSDSINTLSFLPKSIAITGSGIIAVEYAKIFSNLGTDVTLIIRDKNPRNALMKIGLDIDVAGTLISDILRSGIKIEKGCQVSYVDVPKDRDNLNAPIKLGLTNMGSGTSKPNLLSVDAYIAAVGRTPNTANLNLDAAGIEVDEYGGILVDSSLVTTASNVYGAGDVLGRPFLASTGVAQGIAAVESMFTSSTEKEASRCLDEEREEDKSSSSSELCIDGDISRAGVSYDPKSLASNPFAFPTGVWSSPEAAYFGLSLQQATDMGINATEAIALYTECLRGRVFSPNGLLKLVYEKPVGRILGVHICGDDACELIHYGMELVKAKRTITYLHDTVYSAVTFHEMYRIAAQAAIDPPVARRRRAAVGKSLADRRKRARVCRSNK